MRKCGPWFLCVLSSALLVLAFPRTDLWALAWAGLVPLMFALDGKRPWAAFRSAYLCGFLFFAGTLYWFFNITRWFGWIAAFGVLLLLSYLALYFGVFGLGYSLFSGRKTLARLFLLPSAWVALEFIRAHLFTGFDWASMGHSQYKNLPVIQIADMTGVFGVSFVVVMVNVLLKEWLTAVLARKGLAGQKQLAAAMAMTAAVITAVLGYGLWRLSEPEDHAASLPVAVIQADIPQEEKWQESAGRAIVAKHIALSEQAATGNPGLIIWPETSCTDYLWDEKELFLEIQAFVRRVRIPLLFGSVVKEGQDYYNAAVLLSGTGEVRGIYRKVHLVPFGEFIPLRRFLPFLTDLLGIGDFSRGEQYATFPDLRGSHGVFSVLICFEDTVARLSRKFVGNGAQLLVNITNDAWFGDTKAPFMHLQSSVFRTVENRKMLVRAANTGISGLIDAHGRIIGSVEAQKGPGKAKTYVSGFLPAEAVFNNRRTVYTKFGDVFAILCFGCILMGTVGGKSNSNRVGQ